MYEHPYFTHQVTRYEQEEMVRLAERRRVIAEQADRVVPRRIGAVGRMLRRIGLVSAGRAPRPVPCEPATAR